MASRINIGRGSTRNVCSYRKFYPCAPATDESQTPGKKSITVLILKKEDPTDVTNWRPIAMCRTLYKILMGCVADRLTKCATENNAISQCQKGFMPADGAFEHTYTLNRPMEKTRCSKSERCVAWLDVCNAFDAVPHTALISALDTMGVGAALVSMVKDVYTNVTTRISTGLGTTGPINIKSGIKQGCPLSGMLFNCAIDHVIRKAQANATEHRDTSVRGRLVPNSEQSR